MLHLLSRTKIYAALTSYAADDARAQQQTGRVAIDRRDRQTDRRVYERTRDRLMRLPHSLLCGSRNRSCASWLAVAVWSRNTWITFAHNRLERRLITWQWNRIAHSINISPSLTLASAFLKPFFSVTDIFVFFCLFKVKGRPKSWTVSKVDNFATVRDRQAYDMSKVYTYCLEKNIKLRHRWNLIFVAQFA